MKNEKWRIQSLVISKSYSHVGGIDFGDIFSLVSKLTSIRFILSISDTFEFEVEQMDVKKTFLHGDLKKKST
jgi:hypothetical protein